MIHTLTINVKKESKWMKVSDWVKEREGEGERGRER
jgi:hypothetical protein